METLEEVWNIVSTVTNEHLAIPSTPMAATHHLPNIWLGQAYRNYVVGRHLCWSSATPPTLRTVPDVLYGHHVCAITCDCVLLPGL